MGRVKELSAEVRAQVLALKKVEYSNCAIGGMLNINESCVRKTEALCGN